MTVIIQKSTCYDCIWKESCGNLQKINEMRDRRNNPGHTNDILEAIIVTCSLKNYDRSYNGNKDESGMYYCTECNSMHHEWSRIGKTHKEKMQEEMHNRNIRSDISNVNKGCDNSIKEKMM